MVKKDKTKETEITSVGIAVDDKGQWTVKTFPGNRIVLSPWDKGLLKCILRMLSISVAQ